MLFYIELIYLIFTVITGILGFNASKSKLEITTIINNYIQARKHGYKNGFGHGYKYKYEHQMRYL